MTLIDQSILDIYVEEAGSPNARVWQESVTLCGGDFESLRCFAANGLIDLHESQGQLEIRGRDKVGTLLLPSGRRVVIGTKVPGISLLEWLAYLGDFPELTAWTRQQAIASSGQFQKCLCELFLNELDIVTRVHLRKGFQPVDVESSLMRGRLDVSRLSRKPWRLPKLPQTVRMRTFDVDFNIVLAIALDRMVPHHADLSIRHQKCLAHLRDVWSGVSRAAADRVSLVNSVQMDPPHGYRRALQIARLLILGATLDPHRGVGGRVFTISLANVWERGLRRMFVELQQELGWKMVPDKGRIRHWLDSEQEGDSSRWMVADLMLVRGGERMVLDAKYKCDFGKESREDRFQICAYAIAFDASKVALAFPEQSEQGVRRLLETTFGKCSISVSSMSLPMTLGPSKCKALIRELVGSL